LSSFRSLPRRSNRDFARAGVADRVRLAPAIPKPELLREFAAKSNRESPEATI